MNKNVNDSNSQATMVFLLSQTNWRQQIIEINVIQYKSCLNHKLKYAACVKTELAVMSAADACIQIYTHTHAHFV